MFSAHPALKISWNREYASAGLVGPCVCTKHSHVCTFNVCQFPVLIAMSVSLLLAGAAIISNNYYQDQGYLHRSEHTLCLYGLHYPDCKFNGMYSLLPRIHH